MTTLDAANAYVPAFLRDFDRRFAVPPRSGAPAQSGSAYRPLPPHLVPAAAARARVFCFKYLRTVGNDNTVQFAGQRLQVLPGPSRRSHARARVELREHLDGSLAVYTAGGGCIAVHPASAEAPLFRAGDLPRVARPPLRAAPSPPADAATPAPPSEPKPPHPWTQSYRARRPDQHDLDTAVAWRTRPMRTKSLITRPDKVTDLQHPAAAGALGPRGAFGARTPARPESG